jgi:hypothetical protein
MKEIIMEITKALIGYEDVYWINGPDRETFTRPTPSGGITTLRAVPRPISPEMFGAVADGTTDCGAAINRAIETANGQVPVIFSNGIYASSVTINANISGTHLIGVNNGYVYGPTASASSIKFTGALASGITQYAGAVAQAYITIENLTINGNSLVTDGINGGYFVTVKNSTVINCTGAGMKIVNGQATKIVNSAMNGNQDGLSAETAWGTLYVEQSSFRQNTRYGMSLTGVGGASNVKAAIFESNTSHGLYINGTFANLEFDSPYFEANDAAAGANGYHIEITQGPYQEIDQGIIFNNSYTASGGSTKVLNMLTGRAIFHDSSHVGDTTLDCMTIAAGAEVILDRSFKNYPCPVGAKISPEVSVDPLAALIFATNTDYIDISGLTIAFGAADFSVSFVVEPNRTAISIRDILGHANDSLGIRMAGANTGMTYLSFNKIGAAAFWEPLVDLRADTPHHFVYSRISSIGYLYQDGVLIGSHADANNYTADQERIGQGDPATPNGMESKLYQFALFSAGLTGSQAWTLWKNGGNALAAGLIASDTLNLQFSKIVNGTIYDAVSETFLFAPE